jgi:hypothetical protein
MVGTSRREQNVSEQRPSLLMRIWIWLTPNLTQYQRGVRLRVLTLSSIFVVVLVFVVVEVMIKASRAG